ncbi:hypothetical protein [Arenimonas caeni]|jgi:hypothetical protein|uniref:Uncharacterized protein n=1 Tax=Arenimonas caeni TaxID=2058085 RepID=A0A2P6MB91_9GAMM|nr:hypothetical protein [Arenimonas caeni]MDY0022413.1 hypothetical protein [Arenimonas caeni]PRH83255.1 hypothetical protein C6N40_03615 [Arenimonas caeni]
MTRKSTPRRRTATATPVTPRTVLLAGLGAFALTRREAVRRIRSAADRAAALRGRADTVANEAGRQVARLREQAEAIAERAQAEFESRFIQARPAARKPRRAARPATGRAVRKRA